MNAIDEAGVPELLRVRAKAPLRVLPNEMEPDVVRLMGPAKRSAGPWNEISPLVVAIEVELSNAVEAGLVVKKSRLPVVEDTEPLELIRIPRLVPVSARIPVMEIGPSTDITLDPEPVMFTP